MFQGKFVLLQLCEIWTLRSAARVNTEWWTLEVLGIFGCVMRADSQVQDSECFPPGWSPVG